MPFAWGTADCVQTAARMVELFTGRNPAYGKAYDSERAALRLIAEAGGLEALVTEALGKPRTVTMHGHLIQPGDIVLTCYRDYGHMLGVAQPARAWYRVANLVGLVPVQLDQALKFWGIEPDHRVEERWQEQ